MKIGDKVTWQQGKKTKTGVIHGVRKAENENGTEKIIGYLVDTGKAIYSEKRENDKGKTETFVQPEMADLTPDQVSLAD